MRKRQRWNSKQSSFVVSLAHCTMYTRKTREKKEEKTLNFSTPQSLTTRMSIAQYRRIRPWSQFILSVLPLTRNITKERVKGYKNLPRYCCDVCLATLRQPSLSPSWCGCAGSSTFHRHRAKHMRLLLRQQMMSFIPWKTSERKSEWEVSRRDNLSCSSLDEFNTSLARWWHELYADLYPHRFTSTVECEWVCREVCFYFSRCPFSSWRDPKAAKSKLNRQTKLLKQ